MFRNAGPLDVRGETAWVPDVTDTINRNSDLLLAFCGIFATVLHSYMYGTGQGAPSKRIEMILRTEATTAMNRACKIFAAVRTLILRKKWKARTTHRVLRYLLELGRHLVPLAVSVGVYSLVKEVAETAKASRQLLETSRGKAHRGG